MSQTVEVGEEAARPLLGRRPFAASRSAPRRNLGLDVARAAAIGLVLLSHSLSWALRPSLAAAWAAYLVLLGDFGVELFFSLSGFLIGQLLIVLAEGPLDGAAVGRFLGRRWLRTLPLYYVVLGFVAWQFGHHEWRSFLFLQNVLPAPTGLPVSWSLVLEEYFYLSFPLMMLLLHRSTRPRLRGAGCVLAVAFGLLTACTAGRFAALAYGFGTGDPSFHTAPLLRGDCASWGVIAACLDRWLSRRPGSSRLPLLIGGGGFVLLAVNVVLFLALFEPRLARALHASLWLRLYLPNMWSLIDLAFALIVLCLSRSVGRLGPVCGPAVGWTSRLSYSLYLVHMLVIGALLHAAVTVLGVVGGVAVNTLAALLVAAGTYFAIERPFLHIRDELLPARKGGSTAARCPGSLAPE